MRLIQLIRNLVKRKPRELTTLEVTGYTDEEIERQLEDLSRQEERREEGQPSAFIKPIIPLPAERHDGWFGGSPRLPRSFEWPVVEGESALFVCQIDLSALPQNIWSGVGPREGWLAVFFHPNQVKASVHHFFGDLELRECPDPKEASWYHLDRCEETSAEKILPEWPVRISAHDGPMPDVFKWRKGHVPGFTDPRENEVFDLADVAFQPCDGSTLSFLLEQVNSEIARAWKAVDVLGEKQLSTETARELRKCAELLEETDLRLHELQLKLTQWIYDFEGDSVSPHIDELASLIVPMVNYLRDDDEGNAVLGILHMKVSEQGLKCQRNWALRYLSKLYIAATYCYTRDPSSLPKNQRARFEAIWAFEAEHEVGKISHLPVGYVYTTSGEGTAREILLELPSSDLVGWMWGDMYSIVLFIDRQDLEHCRFDRVTAEITN